MLKNTASQKIALFAFDTATGAAKTGDAANLTVYVSIDGGAVTVLGDTSASEMSSTNAPGWYLFDLTQGETNGNDLLFTGKSSTGGVSVVGRPVTTTLLTGDAFARLGAPAGASIAADIADLPTNAELATALGTADDAVLTAVAGIATSVDALPTNAELATALGTADDAVLAAIAGLSFPALDDIADAVLTRQFDDATPGSGTRDLLNANRFIRNGFSISGATLTVLQEDDTTPAYTRNLTTDAGAVPIVGVD
jgi:hypothetical protein